MHHKLCQEENKDKKKMSLKIIVRAKLQHQTLQVMMNKMKTKIQVKVKWDHQAVQVAEVKE